MLAEIKEASNNHAEAKKQISLVMLSSFGSSANAIQALIRDGYRCITTGLYDHSPNSGITDGEMIATGGACITRCIHIVPDSVYLN